MKHVMVRYRVKPEALPDVERAIHAFVQAVQKEEDTYVYETFKEPDGVTFVHFMSFRDGAAERSHREAPYTKSFTMTLYFSCEEEPVFTELTLSDWSKHPSA